jgi:4-hydroxy-tetrahydrodipicolinate reductase
MNFRKEHPMNIKIIVTGVKGRMGSTVARLVQEDTSLELAGVVEKKDRLQDLEKYDCPFGSDLSDILLKTGKCVVIDFTSPEASMDVALKCSQNNAAAVMGTTGFTRDQLGQLEKLARRKSSFLGSQYERRY